MSLFFFFNDTATTEIYTLSLHDALPISSTWLPRSTRVRRQPVSRFSWSPRSTSRPRIERSSMGTCCRSEEHTSELQSHLNLVCRLLLEKKNIRDYYRPTSCLHTTQCQLL